MGVFGRTNEHPPICAHCGKVIEGEPTQIGKGGFRPRWKLYHAECLDAGLGAATDELLGSQDRTS
jgi:hypothetical protein